MNEHLRQTGRSCALLKQALSYAIEGFPVTYYVKDRGHKATVEQQLREVCQAYFRAAYRSDRIPSSLVIREIPEDFSWVNWKPLDAYGHVRDGFIYFVDHYVVELKTAELQMRVLELSQLISQLQPYAAGAEQPVNVHIQIARQQREQLRKLASFKGERDTTSQEHNS